MFLEDYSLNGTGGIIGGCALWWLQLEHSILHHDVSYQSDQRGIRTNVMILSLKWSLLSFGHFKEIYDLNMYFTFK